MHERELALWIKKHARGICVDIGAGTGVHTKVMASVPEVKVVYAFEPIPYNYRRIQALNLPKVKVMPFALGKEEGVLRLYAEDIDKPTEFEWINACAIKTEKPIIGHGFEEYIDVEVKPLNKVIDHADFIKVDVEGMEYEVILGAKGVYEKAWMVIELHKWGEYELKEFLDLLFATHTPLNTLPKDFMVWHIYLKPKMA